MHFNTMGVAGEWGDAEGGDINTKAVLPVGNNKVTTEHDDDDNDDAKYNNITGKNKLMLKRKEN